MPRGTESKKLQTVDRGGWLAEAESPKLRASQASIAHDARIAHDQRELIALLKKRLSDALAFIEYDQAGRGLSLTDAEWDDKVAKYRASGVAVVQLAHSYIPKAAVNLDETRKALSAAAPFLED